MRTALNATLIRGRHRLGLPGLVSVTTFVEVASRSVWVRLFRRGRHSWNYRPSATLPRAASIPAAALTRIPAPATASVRATELHAA